MSYEHLGQRAAPFLSIADHAAIESPYAAAMPSTVSRVSGCQSSIGGAGAGDVAVLVILTLARRGASGYPGSGYPRNPPGTGGDPMLDTLDRILPLPYPHFMGFAPLDAWWRLLTQDRAWKKIPARYWVRIAGGLFTSCIGTAITLPERVLLWPLVRGVGGGGGSGRPAPPTVFVLGYDRSGTTHLHYLLSCDPNLATPRWYQMLAPQGFGLSWTFLRYFLVPFLSSTRPQDDVAYGSEYPAEDDFGVCNWACCGTMPGRMVVPRCWEYYARYHTLEGFSERELERFRRTQMGLTWKLGALNRGRMLLLKTPAHTARVAELARMYGDAARFIHVHRDPMPVVKSNVAMHGAVCAVSAWQRRIRGMRRFGGG